MTTHGSQATSDPLASGAPAGPARASGADADLRALDVVVLSGGVSSERAVSLDSGMEVAASLSVDDGRGPRRVRPVEIEDDGRWRVGGASLDAPRALTELAGADVFFLAVHGGTGEDGTLQGFLESAGRVFTGSGVIASAVCMDKRATRALADSLGLATAPGVCLARTERERLEALTADLADTARVVKPRCGGSSVATFVVPAGEPLDAAVDAVLATGDDCLVEACVEGVEVSCGVLGNRGEDLRALPPVEIRPAAGRFFDYEQKYDAQGAVELCPPRSLDAEAVARVQAAARGLHAAAGCDGYSRIDFILPEGGAPVLLEANTLPGFTARSLLPQEAAAVGMPHRDLCLWVLAAALRRREARP